MQLVESALIRRTLADQVADHLRQQIRLGLAPPGTRLRQRDVAQRYEVSITPVREAFSQLEREGLLVSAPHRGMLVFRPTADDLSEIYDIRVPLEIVASQKAAQSITDDELRALRGLLADMRTAVADREAYTQLNREYHMAICRAARSPRLEKMIADLRDASTAYLRLFTEQLPTAEQSQRDHEAIFDALQSRDVAAVADAIRQHLEATVRAVRDELRDAGITQPGTA